MIRIGAAEATASCLLPPLLVRWAQTHPGVPIRLRVLSPAAICAGLRENELDIGFMHGVDGTAGLLARRWIEEPWLVVARPQHPLAQGVAPISLDMMRHQAQWAWLATSATAQDAVRRRFESGVGALHIALGLGSVQAVIAIVQSSDLLAFLPRHAVQPALHRNALATLETEGMPLNISLEILRNPDVRLSGPVADFLDFCRAEAAALSSMLDWGALTNPGS